LETYGLHEDSMKGDPKENKKGVKRHENLRPLRARGRTNRGMRSTNGRRWAERKLKSPGDYKGGEACGRISARKGEGENLGGGTNPGREMKTEAYVRR